MNDVSTGKDRMTAEQIASLEATLNHFDPALRAEALQRLVSSAEQGALAPERLHDRGFGRTPEGAEVHLRDGLVVVGLLGPDHHLHGGPLW